MKKLALFALAVGSVVVACAPPTTINLNPTGGSGGETTDPDETGGVGGSGAGETIGVGGGGEYELTAHDVYVYEVHDSLIATCGGCHNPVAGVGAPVFLDYDPELSYSVIKAYPYVLTEPAESILITQLPHTGPALSDTQKELVGKWLSMELAEAEGGGTGGQGGGTGTGTPTDPPVTLESLLEEFAACMDYDLWVASGMDKFPLQQTNGEGPCMSCHNTGAGALWLSGDSLETFEKNRMFPYVMRLVSPVYEGSSPVDLAPSQRLVNKGKEPCANPPVCHPKYELNAQNKAALEQFVSTTLQKWQSGTCPSP